MFRFFSIFGTTCFLITLFTMGSVRADEKADWMALFDGKTLSGWTQKSGPATYRVQDGTILGTTGEGGPNSFLCTEKDYGDFELEFEVKLQNGLNSGVQIRSQQKIGSDGKPGPINGPQVEIEATSDGSPDGAESGYIYGESTGRAWLTPKERLLPHKHFKDGQWNKYRVLARGPRIQTWVNGQKIEDLTDAPIFKTHAGGFIGLQVHAIAHGTGPYDVAWRNIRIREL